MLAQAWSDETKEIEVARRSEQPMVEQEGNWSHTPQEEEEVTHNADEAEDELRVPLHQTLPEGCSFCSPPKTTTFAAK
jgi:hypothetical protein